MTDILEPSHPLVNSGPAVLAETASGTHPTIDRRTLLLGVGAMATAWSALAPAQPAEAQTEAATHPAMRTPGKVSASSMQITTPPLAVLTLNKMGFGPRPGDIEAFLALAATPDAAFELYVDQQLNPFAIDDSACDGRLAAQGFLTLAKTRSQLWIDHFLPANLPWEDRMRPIDEIEQATMIKGVYSKRQLFELLADFWHNHFNIYAWDYWAAPQWVHYDRDVIRGNMLGNFRQMLGEVAKSTAMNYYLDNASNTSAGPNENYARELFELHGMGAENYGGVVADRSQVPVDGEGKPKVYIDKDVYQATECFTGWRIDSATGDFKFDDKVHSKYEKTVLGVNFPDFQGVQDGEKVLDLIAQHRGTAQYIARKLCRRLISDTPPESVVQAAAAVFYDQRNAPDQLKQVMRTILLSNEFRTTWGQKIKRPLDYVLGLLRATNADFVPNNDFLWNYGLAGQALFSWRPPNGYPDFKEAWSSTMPMLQRWRRCNWLLGWTYGGLDLNKDQPRINLLSQQPSSLTTATQLVEYWCNRLLGYQLPESERLPVIDFMAHGHGPTASLPAEEITERLSSMVGLILMSPSFLWR